MTRAVPGDLSISMHVWLIFCHQLHIYMCVCLLLISMLWHRQAIFESKGDKLSSSAECRILTQGLRHQTVASFTKQINQRLAKRPLVFNGRLANRWFTSLVKEATNRQQTECPLADKPTELSRIKLKKTELDSVFYVLDMYIELLYT